MMWFDPCIYIPSYIGEVFGNYWEHIIHIILVVQYSIFRTHCHLFFYVHQGV